MTPSTAGPLTAQVALPDDLIDVIAARAAELVAAQLSPAPEQWIGVDEAAAHLCCPKSRIYRLVSRAKGGKRSNPIPHEKDGSRLLFRRSDLDAWLARGGADYQRAFSPCSHPLSEPAPPLGSETPHRTNSEVVRSRRSTPQGGAHPHRTRPPRSAPSRPVAIDDRGTPSTCGKEPTVTTTPNTYMKRALRKAAASEGWLPDGTGIDAIDQLRDRHLTALRVLRDAMAQRQALTDRHEQEDRQRTEAMVRMAHEGKVPDVPGPDADRRKAELSAAQDAVKAADTAFEQTIAEIHVALRDVASEVDGLVAERHREAEEARLETERLLTDATARVRAVKKLDVWFDRAVPGRGHFPQAAKWPIAWSNLPSPPAEYVPDDTALRLAGLGHTIPDQADAFETVA